MFRKRDTHIHFVGIGGIGMSGIAEVLLNLGYRVTGTDLAESDTTERLARLGANVHQGHSADFVGDADVVVVSSAVGLSNPEVVAARQRKIPVIPRAEMLAELMRLKEGIAIAGSHGKTTTTSLVAAILHAGGIDPTVVIGGKVNSFDSNARLGRGDVLLAEADESDGSFLLLTPTFGVITNIDNEHMDHYGSLPALLDAFVGFANRVPFYGMAAVCLDDPNVASILPRLSKRFVTYGITTTTADYVATSVVHSSSGLSFRVVVRGRDRGEFSLAMHGVHNVRNALAAIAIADEYQVDPEVIREALATFAGVQRRFTLRGEARGVVVVDDYGHHPTEIQATLSGARQGYAERRVVAVLQPHRYTRLRDNFDGFVRCLDHAHLVVLADIYSAGEAPLPGVTIDALADRLRQRDPARTIVVEKDFERLPERVAEHVTEGDLVLTLGAGSITRVGPRLLERLSMSPAAG
ncbi:UDP-N-acetylmuramate--L-alanine ligase [Paraliomyxa miuraensis]|uniref:UDP-N-acetylmuramate--L-alanine ligase n=1 Tax=Paraliomyxa miuraensis TaxID=376150 RepID=UPI00225C265D|nr:UDP-N-acetylmuramate--L-alanine ligase [Paraliomyxa miuraensis]MCX4242136.1 UDP-N-acetylmuramate--L-alanine ligase [Paraliomyxa miuraensis]